MSPVIYKVQDFSLNQLTAVIAESESFGFRAIQRFADEWNSGANRFDRPGEALFLAKQGNHVIGICGLNIDPYTKSSSIGRVRRLYVMGSYRRRGIGRTLVRQVIAEACLHFDYLHVRTDAPIADQFYQSLGFTPHLGNEYYTHRLDLKQLSRSYRRLALSEVQTTAKLLV
jgi:ribosomal protein S18 acetylase RimI-like enzyme